MSGKGRAPKLHAESLLRIPLVERAFADERIRPQARAIDRNWTYEGHVARSMVGFNPFAGQFFHGARSRLADWLDHTRESARAFNPRDQLVGEVLFGVHDYLHCWAYGFLRARRPKLGLGSVELRADNVESMVFVHLATEAAATVGLDYWYLATVDLADVCPIGTAFRSLTADYHERRLPEYRRARPDLEVQAPEFFAELAEFYCTGVLHGFDIGDVAKSPLLDKWLRHELTYGETQRRYTREWFCMLGGLPFSADDGARPVAIAARWQRELLDEIGRALWDLVKRGKDSTLAIARLADTWQVAPARAADPRFVNVNALDPDELVALGRRTAGTPDFSWFVDQYVSRFDYARFDKDKLPLLAAIRDRRDVAPLVALCKGEALLATLPEPRDLMLLN